MKRMYVRLRVPEIEALMDLAQRNRRHPHDEAALLIRQELERRGFLGATAKSEGWVLTHEGHERVTP